MKLWPFSKKSEAPAEYERKFELPPGVMLASPDEAPTTQAPPATQPGRYDAMHAEEEAHPLPMEAKAAPTVPETKPDLQQFFEQNQLAFVSQQAEPPVTQQTDAPLPNPLPNKGELYQEINQSLSAMAETPPPPVEPQASFTAQTALPQPLSTQAAPLDFGLGNNTINHAPPKAEPLFSPKTTQQSTAETLSEFANEPDDSFLFMPEGASHKPHPTESGSTETFNLDLLVPPPLNDTMAVPPGTTLDTFAPTNTDPGFTDLFNTPEPSIGFGQSSELLCDLSSDLLATAPETSPTFSEAEASAEMDSFFPADTPTLPEMALETDDTQALLDELLKDPEFCQQENISYYGSEPESITEPLFEEMTAPFADITEPAAESLPNLDSNFFSTVAFDDMADFNSYSAPENLFAGGTEQTADPTASILDSSNLPEAHYSGYPELDETSLSSDEEEATYYGDDYSDDEITGDAELNSEVSSYDMGHYDDPDEPAQAFSLDVSDYSETTSYVAAEDSETDLDALMASLTHSHTAHAEMTHTEPEPVYTEEPEPVALNAASDEPAYEMAPEPIPMEETLTNPPLPEPKAIQPQAEPAPRTFEKPAPVAAQSKSEQPAPLPPKKRPTPAYPQPRPKFYTDSIAEALESFEEEVMLKDNRFLRDSINNLVDQYFAQQESENR